MAYRETEKIQARKADIKAKILNAARQLVAEHGFAGLTMSATAKRAAVATGSMYRYYPNKIALCTALFRQLSGREVDQMQAIADMPLSASDALARCCFDFTLRAFRAPVQSYALMAEPLDPALEQERLIYRRAYAEVYQTIIERGIADRSFTVDDSHIASLAIVGMLAEPLLEPLFAFYNGNNNSQTDIPDFESQNLDNQSLDNQNLDNQNLDNQNFDSQNLALNISRLCLNSLGAFKFTQQEDFNSRVHRHHFHDIS